MFNFFLKVRFPGERNFFFEGAEGETATRIIHAVHYTKREDAERAAAAMLAYGAVEEVRVFENVEGLKHPRRVATYKA